MQRAYQLLYHTDISFDCSIRLFEAHPMSVSKKEKLEIIHHILHGVEEYWLDPSGIIYASNLEATRITGYEEHEVIGKHYSILYTEAEANQGVPAGQLTEALLTGTLRVKGIRVKKNKLSFLAALRFLVVERENGDKAIKMTLQDTTYKAVQKHKLKRAESHFNSLFQNSFIGILNLDESSLRILMGNIKATVILGDSEIADKHFTDYLNDPESINRFKRIVETSFIGDFEVQLIQPGGSRRWVIMRCSTFSSEEIIEVVFFDITGEKKTIDRLERINHHLDQFIYHVSHDLRSPLTTILGLLHLSKKEKTSIEGIHSYVDLMIERTTHLDCLLLDLTSIAFNEKTDLDVEPVDLETLARSVLNEYTRSNKMITATLHSVPKSILYSDSRRLRSVLRNLISNAVRYYNPVQNTPFVKLSVTSDDEKAQIIVQDNGIGINPMHIDKIYTMFFRATDRSSGSGLGLYIVKEIVDKMNGKISLTSIPSEGSTFTVTIPNAKNIAAVR